MGTREGFINAIENGKFDYWFLEDLQPKEGRKYRLEGYLYPDTYYFFTDWSEEQTPEIPQQLQFQVRQVI